MLFRYLSDINYIFGGQNDTDCIAVLDNVVDLTVLIKSLLLENILIKTSN